MEQKNNMLHEEDLTQITALGVVSKEEARYYMSCLRTATRIVNTARIDPLETPDELIAVVFSKIAKNLFWLREQGEKIQDEEETEDIEPKEGEFPEFMEEDETKETEKTEKINTVDIPVMPGDLLGETLEVVGIKRNDEDGIFEIQTDKGRIGTQSKVLQRQVLHLQDSGSLPTKGKIEKKKSGNGREYYSFLPENIEEV